MTQRVGNVQTSSHPRTCNIATTDAANEDEQLVRNFLSGRETIISHAGTSQYRGGGVSACGLAALNFARVMLGQKQAGLRDEIYLRSIIDRKTFEEIISICYQWKSNSHLEVEEIAQVPLFDQTLELVSSHFDKPTYNNFKKLLLEMQAVPTSVVCVITRPPEIIACAKIQTSSSHPIFALFDSHPRPSHPNGAAITFDLSADSVTHSLTTLLAVDTQLFADSSMQWQAQLLGQFSGHIFVTRTTTNLMKGVLEASLRILALQAEITGLKSHNKSLQQDSVRLKATLLESEAECREAKKQLARMSRSNSSSNAEHRPTRLPMRDKEAPQSLATNSQYDYAVVRSSRSPITSSPLWSGNHHNQGSLPHQSQPAPSKLSTWKAKLPTSDWEHPLQAQCQSELENRQLAVERHALASAFPSTFTCGVCQEQQSVENVARVDKCGHVSCRHCLRGHICDRLSKHEFPVYCPTCLVEKRHNMGVITDGLVQEIGVPEKEYEILVELQLYASSILLHCRKCQRSTFVDRTEYQASKTITCPLPQCNHVWCRGCGQEIYMGGTHSCNGSLELKIREWRYCPSCKTPIRKDSGRNYMTCMSPGCNTHICFICGNLIIKSALGRDIKQATTAHFRKCDLFKDIADRKVPSRS